MPIIDKSKPWKVNRKSWHYKVYMFLRETPVTNNFCNYFWLVMFKSAFLLALLGMVLFLVVMYIVAWFTDPLAAALGTSVICAIIGGFAYVIWRSEKKKEAGNTQPNIVVQWIHTKKEKYCPSVEYVDE